MPCTYKCGIEHGYSEPCGHPESPFYDAGLKIPDLIILDDVTDIPLTDEGKEKLKEWYENDFQPLSQVERNRRWRERNPEQYKKQQERAMRKRRES